MGAVLFFWIARRGMLIAKIILGTVAIIAVGLIAWGALQSAGGFKGTENASVFKSVFIRDISTNQHLAFLKEGTAVAAAHPLGIGLGTVGPASFHFKKFLTENWFLQIADEMGIPGLLLFLGILFLLSKKLLADKSDWMKRGLFLSLLGICVAGLFTHSFEETTTALLLFGVVGLNVTQ